MLHNKKSLLIAFACLAALTSFAQNSVPDTNHESGFMRSEGKIYVVMVVVITILFGLILFMLRLDIKLSKLEKGESL